MVPGHGFNSASFWGDLSAVRPNSAVGDGNMNQATKLPVNFAFYKCLEALANLGRASSIWSRGERHLDHLY
jgi:hypothetical protein